MTGIEFIRSLGGNPMATVDLAREPALDRLVAVKKLRPELCNDPIAVERFEREGQSAARIIHPNVCSVHRVGHTPEGVPFIIMEYIEGRTLNSLVAAEGCLEIERALSLLSQVASAIAAAHEKRVIHRDMRPANVMIERKTGRVVLTDFGIAAIHASGTELVSRLTRKGEKPGNPVYASPEQRSGAEVTEASDVYSLGLVGVDVLNALDPEATDNDPDSPVALHASIPVELRKLIKRCLADNPENRPSATTVRDALTSMADNPEALTESEPGEGSKEDDSLSGVGFGFLVELRRRKVYRVAVAYLATAIVLIEVFDVIGPTLRVPDWLFPILVAVLLGGFPIAVVLAWTYDITRQGLHRTQEKKGIAGARRILMYFVLPYFGLAMSIATAIAVGWWILKS